MDEQYIINKVKELLPDEHHVPRGVLYSKLKTAVQKDLSDMLNQLLTENRLTYNKTLNDLLININENGE